LAPPTVPPRPFYHHVTRGLKIGAALPEMIANHAIALYASDLAAEALIFRAPAAFGATR
jgi:hypothetical protein